MEWDGFHMWGFEARRYGERIHWPPLEDDDDAEMTIQDILDFLHGNRQFDYIYDFGDCWEHRITIGQTQKAHGDRLYPYLVSAVGRAPIEDIGGSWGYDSFLHALNNPGSEYPEHLAGLIESFPDWDPHDAHIEKLRENLSEFAS